MYSVTRTHDFSAGHRVAGHEGACAHLHGHNYRVHLTCESDKLDVVGRVIDFAEIKLRLCRWIDEHWDHKFLIYGMDIACMRLMEIDPMGVVPVQFNPTAENMARFLVEEVGPVVFTGTGIVLTACVVEETRKCAASFQR